MFDWILNVPLYTQTDENITYTSFFKWDCLQLPKLRNTTSDKEDEVMTTK